MRRKHRIVTLIVGILVALGDSARAGEAGEAGASADFFVAPSGNDSWSGRLAAPNATSSDGPFATLGRARDAIRELKKRDDGLKRDVKVLIRGGVYRLSETLVLGPEDSGADQHSITYAAYPGEKPILSGGRVIKGWKRAQGELWTAEIPEVKTGQWLFREMFVGGERRVRARSPQEGFFRIEKAQKGDRMKFTFRDRNFQNWKDLSDVEMVLFYDWEIARARVAGVDEQTSTVHFQYPCGPPGQAFWDFCQFDPHQRYYLENALEFLDTPGEWHLDRHAGLLTYWPLKGEDMNRVEVVAPVLERLLRANGTLEQPIRNLHVQGITFSHTDWPLPKAGYNGIQACFYSSGGSGRSSIPAAVQFTAAIGCSFEDNRILRIGTSGLFFERGCRANRIVGNEVGDAAGNGIMLGETRGRPTDPSEVSRNNLIANNYIHHCGVDYPGCVGVWIGHTERSTVSHNEICELPYTGISVGWTWNPTPTVCKENTIEYNHIHHVVKRLADAGGIYTLGFQPGTVLRGNLIHDVDKTHGRAPSNGMFIDEGSKGFLVEGNIIYNTPDGAVRFNQSKQDLHTFRDNTFSIQPGAPGFPTEAAAKAGLEGAYRKMLLGEK